MKVCVCSDSHGNAANMDKMLLRETPAVLLFLGDGLRDLRGLTLPQGCRVHAVSGNCDFGASEPELRLLSLEGVRILMMHGHRAAVKASLFRLDLLAQENRADIALYGHTHRQNAQWSEQRLLLCPGSVGSALCSYALLDVQGGRFSFELKNLGESQ